MSQIKDGDNPISLILVETLMGLDVVFHGEETQNFLGSPLTLQIWLMEWLDIISKPTTGNYRPSSFLSKAVIKTKCQTESDWLKFLDKKSSTSIQWDRYWWKCPPPILRIRSYFPCWIMESNFLQGRQTLDEIQIWARNTRWQKKKTFLSCGHKPYCYIEHAIRFRDGWLSGPIFCQGSLS